jgi:hypothetical protein
LLLVLDSNEYLLAFSPSKAAASAELIDLILSRHPNHRIRIPRLIVGEVQGNLPPETFHRFVIFLNLLTVIDEDFAVPFALGAKYESIRLKPADAFIAAYAEWVGADVLISENRHFLKLQADLPFQILPAKDCLALL